MLLLIISIFFFINQSVLSGEVDSWPVYSENPFKIPLDKSHKNLSGRAGGIIAADLDEDGLMDFLVSSKHYTGKSEISVLSAYSHWGKTLWVINNVDIVLTGKAEKEGLPGLMAPGVAVADVDGDGESEVVHLTRNNEIVIRRAINGSLEKKISLGSPDKYLRTRMLSAFKEILRGNFWEARKIMRQKPVRWSHFQIVNLEDENDDEIILQADPYPFKWLRAISLKTGKILWETDKYFSLRHGGFRAVDVDGDGFDEVLGGNLVDDNGRISGNWQYRNFEGHLDALAIGDVLPDVKGIEWGVTEEGAYRYKNPQSTREDMTTLIGVNGVIFYHSYKGEEPQNIAIGEFDIHSPGLEIWCRSRFDEDQKPWVIGSGGKTISHWVMNEVTPKDWSNGGVEFIYSIDWTGGKKMYCAAKERHVDGKICIFDPMNGEFIKWWDENASRLYVADVAGDRREEIIVLNSMEHELRIYWNDQDIENPDGNRLWDRQDYRRQKMNYNYYSP